MKLAIYKPLWGHESSLEIAAEQAIHAGFQGIEGSAPESAEERDRFGAILEDHQLDYIGEVFTGGDYVPDASLGPKEHLFDLEKKIEHTLPLQPTFITTMLGLDAWAVAEKIRVCEHVLQLSETYDITISVELHRSRMTYSPWVTKEILDALPELPLTVDFSHWCCVAERLIMDSEQTFLQQIADQAHHIHARVGYEQGPQVPDPRAPEYQYAVDAHLKWWKEIWQNQKQRGVSTVTMTPEFGTDGYLHLEPYSQKPTANLWEVNQWMAEILRQNWAH